MISYGQRIWRRMRAKDLSVLLTTGLTLRRRRKRTTSRILLRNVLCPALPWRLPPGGGAISIHTVD